MGANTAATVQHQNISDVKPEQILNVQSSFGRALWDPEFLDKFYDIFLNSNPEIGPRFANTDFVKQKDLLRHGLMSVLMFAEGQQSAIACLSRIRDSHGQSKMNIRPELYSYWVDSLVKAVAQCDKKFDAELETDWRTVVAPAVEYISSGY